MLTSTRLIEASSQGIAQTAIAVIVVVVVAGAGLCLIAGWAVDAVAGIFENPGEVLFYAGLAFVVVGLVAATFNPFTTALEAGGIAAVIAGIITAVNS